MEMFLRLRVIGAAGAAVLHGADAAAVTDADRRQVGAAARPQQPARAGHRGRAHRRARLELVWCARCGVAIGFEGLMFLGFIRFGARAVARPPCSALSLCISLQKEQCDAFGVRPGCSPDTICDLGILYGQATRLPALPGCRR